MAIKPKTMDDVMAVAGMVRDWMELGGYSVDDAADVMGVSYKTIVKWRAGDRTPSYTNQLIIEQDVLALESRTG